MHPRDHSNAVVIYVRSPAEGTDLIGTGQNRLELYAYRKAFCAVECGGYLL
jgi:hypothetical protein